MESISVSLFTKEQAPTTDPRLIVTPLLITTLVPNQQSSSIIISL